MMSYEDFKSELEYELALRSGEDYTFKFSKANVRNEGAVDTIVVLFKDDVGVSPQMYTRNYYEKYEEYGTDAVDIALEIISLVDKQKAEVEAVKLAMSTVNAENAKERLIMHVQNKEWNKEMLDEIVYMDFGEDLIGVAKYDLPELDAFITVTKNMQESLCLTEDEIITMALENTKNQEFKMRGLFDVVKELFDDGIGIAEEGNQMYILSNREGHFGANVLLSKDKLQEIEELLNEKYFVLPSSCHEVIVLPESKVDDVEFLRNMVMEVNEHDVDVRDRLSNSVYRVSNGKISICNTKEQHEVLRKEDTKEQTKEVSKPAKRRTA